MRIESIHALSTCPAARPGSNVEKEKIGVGLAYKHIGEPKQKSHTLTAPLLRFIFGHIGLFSALPSEYAQFLLDSD